MPSTNWSDKWKTMLSLPNNQHDWLLYGLFVVLLLAAAGLAVLDLGYGVTWSGITWPLLLAFAVFTLTRRSNR
jgi:hypothetical protein